MLQPLHSHCFQLQVYQVAKLHGSANGCLAHHMPEVGEYTRCTVDGRKYSTQMHNTSFKFRYQVNLMGRITSMNTVHWDEKMLGPRLGASRMAKQLLSTVARVVEIQMHLRCMCFAHVVLVLVLVCLFLFLFACSCVFAFLFLFFLLLLCLSLFWLFFFCQGLVFVSSNTRKSVGKRTSMASECHMPYINEWFRLAMQNSRHTLAKESLS